MNQIEIYQTKDKQTEIEVQFEEDTVWLSLNPDFAVNQNLSEWLKLGYDTSTRIQR